MHSRHFLAGIALAVASSACFAVLDTTVQYLSAFVPLLMALWLRYTFQATAAAAWLLPTRGLRMLHTEHPRFQLSRGLLLLISTGLAFASLKVMPVGEFTAIVMITPLVITLISAVFLKQSVSRLRWLLILGSFVGTIIIIRPNHQGFQAALLLPLGCVASNTAFQLLTSKMMRTEDPLTTQFYTGVVGMVVASLALPFVFVWLDSPKLWALLLLMGVASSAGHFMLIKAYQKAATATLMPYLYAQIAFALVGGWLVFRYVPDGWSMLGMALIGACGALSAWLTVHERKSSPVPPHAPAQSSAASP
jgi:drug/metabolite transporter (DMT)-like permease